MKAEPQLAEFHSRALTKEQRAMLEFLGHPEIIGARWSACYFIADEKHNFLPMIAPPYTVIYLCPVIMAAGVPRSIQANGDLTEVYSDEIDPAPESWD